MRYSKKIGPPLVSAAIAMIVIANFCIVQILARGRETSFELFASIWPIALISTVSMVLVMSFLYHTLEEVMREMERRELAAVEIGFRDPLTGLANRLLLHERLGSAIERYRRNNENFALLMLDLDRFKKVNDVLGHHVGDELLKLVAERLEGLVRETDTIARLGGDEFVIVQTSMKRADDVRRLCGRVSQELLEPFTIDGRSVSIGVSIGAVTGTNASFETAEYLRRSDIALYRAKAEGRNCFRFFSEEMDAEVQRRARLEEDLRQCLTEGQGLDVHYQPQMGAHGRIIGLEALLRWDHPDLGNVPPTEVIAIAEEIGLIEPLGEMVFREACRTALRWPGLFMAVNISPMQFARTAGFPEKLSQIAAEEGTPCGQIELEITEGLFLEQGQTCENHISSLRAAGFRIALDDFGTGYASLSYLRRFQVDKIKLDKSFATNESAEASVAIIRAAVVLAHALGLEVVAEGIETTQHEQIALEAGCDGLQGFRYACAMPVDGVVDYIDANLPEAA